MEEETGVSTGSEGQVHVPGGHGPLLNPRPNPPEENGKTDFFGMSNWKFRFVLEKTTYFISFKVNHPLTYL